MSRVHEAAVQNGKLHHFSVSQVKTFLRAPRQWAGEKLFHLPRTQSAGAALGTKLHKQPEAWYLEGTEPTHEAFLAARPGLPPRDTRILVEHALVDPTLHVGESALEGYSDLIVPPGVRGPHAEIWDWKFVSSFRYTEDPSADLQMLTYGYWAAKKWPDVTHVAVNLMYLEARGTDFRPRKAVVPVSKCEDKWLGVVVPTVQRMQALIASAPATLLDVPLCPDADALGNWAPCRAFGGCPYQAHCGIDTKPKRDAGLDAALAAFDASLTRRT